MSTPSLNETAKRMRDAARGAGWPDGLASDIGNAAAWLSAQGTDGVSPALIAIGSDSARPEPQETEDGTISLGPLPVAVGGPSALDLTLAGDGPVTVEITDSLDLLLGLAGWASAQTAQIVTLSGALNATLDGGRLLDAPHIDPASSTVTLTATPGGRSTALPAARHTPPVGAWAEAGRLAARIMVPATAASRAFGAGAAGTDGD